MNNGVSKKLCITLIGIQAIVQMAEGSPEKFKYAALVAGLIVIYKAVQAFLDWKK
jgi:hypothetical protein